MYELTREPLYKFNNMNSIGINDVPVGSLVCIIDPAPLQSEAMFVMKVSENVIPDDTLGSWISAKQLWSFPF